MKLILSIMFIAATLQSRASQDTTWQITFGKDKVIYNLQLQQLAGDSLIVSHQADTTAIPIEQITEVRLVKASKAGLGALIGTAAGMAAGAIYVAALPEGSG